MEITILREPASARLQRMAEALSKLAMEIRVLERRTAVDLSGDITLKELPRDDIGARASEIRVASTVRLTIG